MSKQPMFLARQTYRRRRLGDAARILPLAGGALFLAPVFLAPQTLTSAAMTFVFVVWAGLIVLTFFLSRALRTRPGQDE